MSAKTRQHYARLAVATIAAATFQAEPSSAQKKNLDRVFTYLSENDGKGPWIVVGRHDLDRMGMIADILKMSSVGNKEDKTIVFRGETFLRFELKKEWASRVIYAFQQQYKQRQDLEKHFR